MHNWHQLISLLSLGILVSACATNVKLPESSTPQADAPKISWSPGTANHTYPVLSLIPKEGGDSLAHIESVFTPDAIAALGRPEGERLLVFASPTGNTVVAHENASESSPDEQIAIFSRAGAAGNWFARSSFPPHQDGPVYGNYGVTRGVDDKYLYYHFPDGALKRIRLTALRTRTVQPREGEQPSAEQPATRLVDEPEGGVQPQPEAEGRSR